MKSATCLAAFVSCLLAVESTLAQQTWTQWGGDNGRNFSVTDTKLSDNPKISEVWKRDLGSGYSGILVEADRLYTHYRDGNDEVVIRLDANSGETLWEHRYDATLPKEADTNFGEGPNSTPLISGNLLITIGFLGDVKCFNKETGDVVWQTSLWKDHDCTLLGFGYSASPLLYKGNVILPVGGKGKALMAFDIDDGSVAWSALDYQISYATPLLAEVDGLDQIILSITETVIGVDPQSGKELWSFPLKNQWDTHAFVPVWDDRNSELFVSSFRQSHALKFSRNGDDIQFEPKWKIEKTGIGFTNAVRIGDVVYGATGGNRSPLITAFDLTQGEVLWRERGFGVSNLIAVGDRLLLLDEKGNLAIAAPDADALNVVVQQQVLESEKGWTFPTVVGDRVYVRNQKQIAVLQLK